MAPRTMRTGAVAAPIAPARTAAPAPAPTRTSTPTHIAPASSGSYAVQISSRHNEADAQASFRSLQAKYPQQLGGRAPLIRRVDLGAKGIYYRAMVGPFGSADEASQVCSRLKAAGGQCIIQRI
jgi:cell division septation protein DedD